MVLRHFATIAALLSVSILCATFFSRGALTDPDGVGGSVAAISELQRDLTQLRNFTEGELRSKLRDLKAGMTDMVLLKAAISSMHKDITSMKGEEGGLAMLRVELTNMRKELTGIRRGRLLKQLSRVKSEAEEQESSLVGPPVERDECDQLRYEEEQGAKLEECTPECKLPELNWTSRPAPGGKGLQDQFGTLLQWDASEWGKKVYEPKVACMINVGVDQQKHRSDIAESWGRHCDGLYFIVSIVHEKQVQQYMDTRWEFFFVPMKRPDNSHTGKCQRHANIWEKSWRMWLRASKGLVDKYDWFIKADTDTFVSVPNLKRFVKYLNPKETAYLGHTLLARWRDSNIAFNAGCGYVLSSGTVRRVGYVLSHIRTTQYAEKWPAHCVDRPGAGEDPTMSLCLRAAGVSAMNTLDHKLRNRFGPFRYVDHYEDLEWPEKTAIELRKSNDYYWMGKHRLMGDLKDCCADEIIVMHNYKGQEGRDYFKQLEKDHTVLNASKPTEVPPKPQCFLFDPEDMLGHPFDAHRNRQPGLAGQTLFSRPGELECSMVPDLSEFTPTRGMPDPAEWKRKRERIVAALKAVSGKWSCFVGQGEYAGSIESSEHNNVTACGDACGRIGNNKCVGFDFSLQKGPAACRMYGPNEPRIGEAGPHDRNYCTAPSLVAKKVEAGVWDLKSWGYDPAMKKGGAEQEARLVLKHHPK